MARSRLYNDSGERDYNPTGLNQMIENARKRHSTFSRRNQAARYRAGRRERYPEATTTPVPTGLLEGVYGMPITGSSVNPLARVLSGLRI